MKINIKTTPVYGLWEIAHNITQKPTKFNDLLAGRYIENHHHPQFVKVVNYFSVDDPYQNYASLSHTGISLWHKDSTIRDRCQRYLILMLKNLPATKFLVGWEKHKNLVKLDGRQHELVQGFIDCKLCDVFEIKPWIIYLASYEVWHRAPDFPSIDGRVLNRATVSLRPEWQEQFKLKIKK